MIVAESFLRGSLGNGGADRLLLGPTLYGVLDGSTAHPWDPPGGPDGAELAELVASSLEEAAAAGGSMKAAVDAATTAVQRRKEAAGTPSVGGACVVFALVNAERRELWRLGDPSVCLGDRTLPGRPQAEGLVAAARALVLRERVADGTDIEALRSSDPGRTAIMPFLETIARLRNHPTAVDGSGAVDGGPVPERFLETVLLGTAGEVVLATDGYPELAMSLAETEQLLAERLARDPLLIEYPPMTKGRALGAESFDDRAFVRLILDDPLQRR